MDFVKYRGLSTHLRQHGDLLIIRPVMPINTWDCIERKGFRTLTIAVFNASLAWGRQSAPHNMLGHSIPCTNLLSQPFCHTSDFVEQDLLSQCSLTRDFVEWDLHLSSQCCHTRDFIEKALLRLHIDSLCRFTCPVFSATVLCGHMSTHILGHSIYCQYLTSSCSQGVTFFPRIERRLSGCWTWLHKPGCDWLIAEHGSTSQAVIGWLLNMAPQARLWLVGCWTRLHKPGCDWPIAEHGSTSQAVVGFLLNVASQARLWLVGCLSNVQATSVSQWQVCLNSSTWCHTETEDSRWCYLTHSILTPGQPVLVLTLSCQVPPSCSMDVETTCNKKPLAESSPVAVTCVKDCLELVCLSQVPLWVCTGCCSLPVCA